MSTSAAPKRKILFWVLGVAAVLVVASAVIGLLVWVISDRNINGNNNDNGGSVFTFDDIFNSTFSPKSLSIQWLSSDSYAYQNAEGDIMQATIKGSDRLLVNASLVVNAFGEKVAIQGYAIDPSLSYALLTTNRVKKWRHSFSGEYLVYSLESHSVAPLLSPQLSVFTPQWSPSTPPAVSYVYEGNLYIQEISGNSHNVTSDGDGVDILNGMSGWVYEEEVFGSSYAYWWAPLGTHLVYVKFDERNVRDFTYTFYNQMPYESLVDIHYPKPGFPNPQVSLGMYEVDTSETHLLPLPTPWEYISQVTWAHEDSQGVFFEALSRSQNSSQIYRWDTDGSEPKEIFSRESPAWIEPSQIPLLFVRNGSYFLTLESSQGFSHVALYAANGTFVDFLTSGNWEVTSLLSYRLSTDSVYFLSTENSPLSRSLFRIQLDGSQKVPMTPEGEGWYSASFSPSGEYYLQNYGGPNVPTQTLRSTADPTWSQVLVDNKPLDNLLGSFPMPRKEFIEVSLENSEKMDGYLIFPPNFDSTKKYSVLISVYGGPDSQAVSHAFENPGFHTYVASSLGMVVGAFDGRGSGARGDAWKFSVYKRLGKFETEDQIRGMEWLLSQSWCEKVGIWGWSYGGFMAGSVFSQEGTPASFGISVAPVSDWRYYDSVYTERYMGIPTDNSVGYNESSLLNRIPNFLSDKYLLVHGTGDDNVHFQNSVELANSLIGAEIQFDTMYYPNRDHSISSGGARRHLYRLLGNFIQRHK